MGAILGHIIHILSKYQPQMNSSGLLMRVGLPHQIVIHYCFELVSPIDKLGGY